MLEIRLNGKNAVKQGGQQHARSAQGDALDADGAEEITDRTDQEDHKYHGKNAADQAAQVFHHKQLLFSCEYSFDE